MIADFVIFTYQHPVITGILIGGGLVGGPLGIIGWCLGYEHAMRKVRGMVVRKIVEKGETPDLPPVRERRQFPTTPGRYV